MMSYISIGEAASLLGVSTSTIRRWEKKGLLPQASRTLGGHRRYNIHEISNFYTSNTSEEVENKTVVAIYARVSGHDQKKDLETQANRLQTWAEKQYKTKPIVIKDCGSGLNMNKRGLNRLLQLIMKKQISVLVINHKDRLLRFGSELIFSLCEFNHIKIVVLEEDERKASFEEQLAKDVIQLMTVFSAKIHGRRTHQNRKKVLAA